MFNSYKKCYWQISIQAFLNNIHKIFSVYLAIKYNSIPLADDSVAVIISTSNCQHTGSCKPFTQQQIIQHADKCENIKWISDVTLLTPCTIYKQKMSLLPNIIYSTRRKE